MNTEQKKPSPLPDDIELIDTHCHLDMRGYENITEVIDSSVRAGVTKIITVGIDFSSSMKAVRLAETYAEIFATIGVHPHSASSVSQRTYRDLTGLYKKNPSKVVGYGEIGLDYAKKYAPRDVQIKEFQHQLAMAAELNLPIIIHDRDAHEDTMNILHQSKLPDAGGVMHCFSGDRELAKKVIDLGFSISIPGIVTFPGSETLQQVVRDIPLKHLLLETDGPFLTPVPYRGKINKPEYLIHTARKVAEIKEVSFEEVARQTTVNAEQLFQLSTSGQIGQ